MVWVLSVVVMRRVFGDGFPPFAIVQLHPVVFSVIHLAAVLQGLSKESTKEVIVGCILKAKVSHVAQVLVELIRKSFAKLLDCGGLLLFSNFLVLLLVGCSLKALPRKTTPQEVHKNVSQCLQVISSRLLASKMGVDTHVTRGARQALALPVWNVLLGLGVPVLLRHTEINNVDNVGSLGAGSANQEVVRLDVAIDEVLLVNSLNP